MRTKKLSLARAERAIGEKAAAWKGRCYEIACKVVDAGLAPGGVAVYGHWIGPIAVGSLFAPKRGLGFCQHGWVLMPDGQILDPTRWAFENRKPYIYQGPADFYDEGGNSFRALLRPPPPDFDPDDRLYRLPPHVLAQAPFEHLCRLLRVDLTEQEPGTFSRGQLFWIANAPYADLGAHARAIYAALAKVGMEALVPIDNWRRAEREAR